MLSSYFDFINRDFFLLNKIKNIVKVSTINLVISKKR